MRKLGLSGCIKTQHTPEEGRLEPEDPNRSPRFPAHHPKKHALQLSSPPATKSCPVGPRRAADTYQQEAGLLQVGERHGSLPRRVRSDRLRGPLQTEMESQQQGIAALHKAQPRPTFCTSAAHVQATGSHRARTAGEPVVKRRTRPAPGLLPAARHPRLTYSSGPGRKGSKEALPESPLWLFKRSLKGVLQTEVSSVKTVRFRGVLANRQQGNGGLGSNLRKARPTGNLRNPRSRFLLRPR